MGFVAGKFVNAVRWLKLRRLFGKPPEEIFTWIFESNYWGSDVSCSGDGSDHIQTRTIAKALPELCRRLNISSMLDIPCGDFQWMRNLDLSGVRYIGADIVGALVERNRQAYGDPQREFLTVNLAKDPLPHADLVFVRDCLVHLSHTMALEALRNIAASKCTWLATTTYTRTTPNRDIQTGDWRPLNLCLPPFSLPPPHELIREGCTEGGGKFADKAVGVWRISDLPA